MDPQLQGKQVNYPHASKRRDWLRDRLVGQRTTWSISLRHSASVQLIKNGSTVILETNTYMCCNWIVKVKVKGFLEKLHSEPVLQIECRRRSDLLHSSTLCLSALLNIKINVFCFIDRVRVDFALVRRPQPMCFPPSDLVKIHKIQDSTTAMQHMKNTACTVKSHSDCIQIILQSRHSSQWYTSFNIFFVTGFSLVVSTTEDRASSVATTVHWFKDPEATRASFIFWPWNKIKSMTWSTIQSMKQTKDHNKSNHTSPFNPRDVCLCHSTHP